MFVFSSCGNRQYSWTRRNSRILCSLYKFQSSIGRMGDNRSNEFERIGSTVIVIVINKSHDQRNSFNADSSFEFGFDQRQIRFESSTTECCFKWNFNNNDDDDDDIRFVRWHEYVEQRIISFGFEWRFDERHNAIGTDTRSRKSKSSSRCCSFGDQSEKYQFDSLRSIFHQALVFFSLSRRIYDASGRLHLRILFKIRERYRSVETSSSKFQIFFIVDVLFNCFFSRRNARWFIRLETKFIDTKKFPFSKLTDEKTKVTHITFVY